MPQVRQVDHQPTLTTRCVRLRAIEPTDLSLIVQWRNEASTYGSFFEYEPLSLAGQDEWFRRHCFSDREKNFIIDAMRDGTVRPVGTISVVNINWRSRNAELGRFLIGDRSARGRGYAPEAIALICEYAFDHLNLHKVYCEVLASQQRIISLHKRFGGVEEGIRREHVFKAGRYEDVVILSLLQEDYKQSERFASIRDILRRRRLRAVPLDCATPSSELAAKNGH